MLPIISQECLQFINIIRTQKQASSEVKMQFIVFFTLTMWTCVLSKIYVINKEDYSTWHLALPPQR